MRIRGCKAPKCSLCVHCEKSELSEKLFCKENQKKEIMLVFDDNNDNHIVISLPSHREPGVISEVENVQMLADKNNLKFSAPPIGLCTDNGVMIAWAGMERFLKGKFDSFDFKARPRWPLDTLE